MPSEYANADPKVIVKLLLDDELYPHAEQALVEIGKRAVPALLKVISDRRFLRAHSKTQRAAQDIMYSRTKPLGSVLRVLRKMPSEDVAKAVVHLTSDNDEEIRHAAMHLLAASGSDKFVEQVAEFLSYSDDYVQYNAITGLLWGQGKHLSALAKKRLIPLIQAAALKGNKCKNYAPACLLHLDEKTGIDFLTSQQSLSPDNSQLYYFMQALKEAEITVPEERLLPLVHSRKLITDSPDVVRDMVQVLARSNSKASLDAVYAALHSPSPEVQEGAALALLTRAGVHNPINTAVQAVVTNSITGVPQPIAYYFATQIFLIDVANGGLSNYFGNTSGDYWRYTREALLALKATPQGALFDQALSHFPKSSPSEDTDERNAQLGKMYEQDSDIFASIEQELFKVFADLDAKLAVFAAANADAFKPYIKLLKK